MAKILKMPLDNTDRAAATTAPQDVLAEDAATFDVLRRMREDHPVLRAEARSAAALRRAAASATARRSAPCSRRCRIWSRKGWRAPRRAAASRWRRSRSPTSSISASCASGSRPGRWPTRSATAPDAWEAEIVSSYFLLNKLGAPRQDDPVGVKREWGKRHKRFHDSLVATCTSPWSAALP